MRKDTWQLQEAKNKFSHLVESAQKNGPQIVTKRGVKAVVVVSYDEYEKMKRSESDIVTFFQTSPLKDKKLKIKRNKDFPRESAL